jgi:hypothetical protein
MDILPPVIDSKTMHKYIEFHINFTMNLLTFLVEEQVPFRIMISDPSRDYKDTLPEDLYSGDTVVLDFINWSLEIATLDPDIPILNSTIVLGEDFTQDIAINAFHVTHIALLSNLKTPIYSRFFTPVLNQPEASITHPEPHSHTYDASAFELSNADGISHSMSILKLCKLGE